MKKKIEILLQQLEQKDIIRKLGDSFWVELTSCAGYETIWRVAFVWWLQSNDKQGSESGQIPIATCKGTVCKFSWWKKNQNLACLKRTAKLNCIPTLRSALR